MRMTRSLATLPAPPCALMAFSMTARAALSESPAAGRIAAISAAETQPIGYLRLYLDAYQKRLNAASTSSHSS